MATSLAEARQITDLCRKAGVKFIVSHQQKYGQHWHKAKAVAERGEIGDLVRIHASSRASLAQLGTHLVDYILWFNGARRAKWVVGHVHGRKFLKDSHPSPDYTEGEIAFENGVLEPLVGAARKKITRLAPDTVDAHFARVRDGYRRYLTKEGKPDVALNAVARFRLGRFCGRGAITPRGRHGEG